MQSIFETRSLPDVLTFSDGGRVKDTRDWERRRTEIAELLQKEEYGYRPAPPQSMEVVEIRSGVSCAGSATEHFAEMRLVLSDGTPFSFPFHYTLPKNPTKPVPAFLHVNFRSNVPDRYMPVEEIIDNGFAVFSFCYTDVTSDDGDFDSLLAGAFYHGRERGASDPGKIALWSWAASRVCDFMQTVEEIDQNALAIVGHSRLGKTALLTGALDPRFTFVASNDAGCSGDAPMRGKVAGNERVSIITDRFPFWFCPKYLTYAGNEETAAFDQHFLLALTAPRFLLTGSAELDLWADPPGQYLSAALAGRVWELYGLSPALPTDAFPKVGDEFSDGCIGYHYRSGTHFFSRRDWGAYMRFIRRHLDRSST